MRSVLQKSHTPNILWSKPLVSNVTSIQQQMWKGRIDYHLRYARQEYAVHCADFNETLFS
jgi:hypothetical protein